MVDNYLQYEEMPLDAWWKKLRNSWDKTPKLSPSDPELRRSWSDPWTDPEPL